MVLTINFFLIRNDEFVVYIKINECVNWIIMSACIIYDRFGIKNSSLDVYKVIKIATLLTLSTFDDQFMIPNLSYVITHIIILKATDSFIFIYKPCTSIYILIYEC
jgi:hypothetical protein